jgi:hypothetical protein
MVADYWAMSIVANTQMTYNVKSTNLLGALKNLFKIL